MGSKDVTTPTLVRSLIQNYSIDTKIVLSHAKIGVESLLELPHVKSARFFATTDASLWTNGQRFRCGFSYGGIWLWICTPLNTMYPLDLIPNACGIILAKASQLIDIDTIRDRILRCRNLFSYRGLWDLGRSNHFIGIYQSQLEPNRYYLIAHGLNHLSKLDSEEYPGLDYLASQRLASLAKVAHTSHGERRYLENDLVIDYFQTFLAIDRLCKEHRAKLVYNIFGKDATILFNEFHQGLVRPNMVTLGAYVINDYKIEIPFAIGLTKNAYIIKPNNPIGNFLTTKEREEFENCGISPSSTYIIPHGSGTRLPLTLLNENAVVKMQTDSNNTWIFKTDNGNFVTDTPYTMFPSYNDVDVLEDLMSSGIISCYTELNHIESFKLT